MESKEASSDELTAKPEGDAEKVQEKAKSQSNRLRFVLQIVINLVGNESGSEVR